MSVLVRQLIIVIERGFTSLVSASLITLTCVVFVL